MSIELSIIEDAQARVMDEIEALEAEMESRREEMKEELAENPCLRDIDRQRTWDLEHKILQLKQHMEDLGTGNDKLSNREPKWSQNRGRNSGDSWYS